MIRMFARLAGTAVLVALSLPVCSAVCPGASTCRTATRAFRSSPCRSARVSQANPANFTATSPTKEVINAFLQTSWGFDENRIWQVQAILKTPVEGVSKVIIIVGDKTGKQKFSAHGILM